MSKPSRVDYGPSRRVSRRRSAVEVSVDGAVIGWLAAIDRIWSVGLMEARFRFLGNRAILRVEWRLRDLKTTTAARIEGFLAADTFQAWDMGDDGVLLQAGPVLWDVTATVEHGHILGDMELLAGHADHRGSPLWQDAFDWKGCVFDTNAWTRRMGGPPDALGSLAAEYDLDARELTLWAGPHMGEAASRYLRPHLQEPAPVEGANETLWQAPRLL